MSDVRLTQEEKVELHEHLKEQAERLPLHGRTTALERWVEKHAPKRARNVAKKRKRTVSRRRKRKAARAHKQKLRRRAK